MTASGIPDHVEPRMLRTPAAPVVALAGITKTFRADPPVHVLRGIDFVVWPGEWISIVGRSGSGKSTLLNILGMLDTPTSGQYRFEGEDTERLTDPGRAALRAEAIRFVFQSFHLLPVRNALENVMLSELYASFPRKGRRERAMAALERVEMADRANFLPSRLSGGERQRVAIARAIVTRPRLLLCDEPTGNLDSETSGAIMELFQGLADEGMTIVVITHDDQVASRAGRTLDLRDGQFRERAGDRGAGEAVSL